LIDDSIFPRFFASLRDKGSQHGGGSPRSRSALALVAALVTTGLSATRPVLLATWQDGQPLDAEGPRLVVPGDIKGGATSLAWDT